MARPRKRLPTVQSKHTSAKIERYKDMVRAAYYSAASDSPSMDFSYATDVGLDEVLVADLNILRQRVRYELRQNAPAKGLTRVYANACVSTGPTLSIEVEEGDEVWAEEAEFAWSEWARNCGYVRSESLAELLHIGVRGFFSAGEYFHLMKYDVRNDSAIKLRVLPIRADRVSEPYGGDPMVIQGVEFDGSGRPTAYHVQDYESSSSYQWSRTSAMQKWVREHAKNVHHVFYQESPEQVRGEPWLAAGLPDLHKRRRYDEARVAAAIVAAKFAVFITQNDPSVSLSASEIMDPGIVELNDGAATVLPAHCGVQSFSGAQPTTGAENFRREMIANAGAGFGMSANASNQDSSTSNFASARYDDVGFGIEQRVVRDLIANRDLTPLAHRWIREASAVGAIPAMPSWYRFVWRWPIADRHTDPLKAANANAARVASAESPLTEIWAEHGKSKEQARQEILEEVEWFRANNLTHPLVTVAAPVVAPVVEPIEEDDPNERE